MTKATCYHTNKAVVWTAVAKDMQPLATRVLRYQCLDCGMILGQSLPHAMAESSTPDVDIAAAQAWAARDRAHWGLHREESQRVRKLKQEEWWRTYNDYLASERWHDKRRKVLDRCKGICEGCGINRATEIHHLTYEHIGSELLWELAATCRECHERAHTDRDGNITNAWNRAQRYAPGPLLRDVPEVLEQEEEGEPETQMLRDYYRP